MGFEPIETKEKLDEIVSAAVEKERENFKGWYLPEKVSEQTNGYTEQIETAQSELTAAKLENAKLKAAMKYGLDAVLAERLRGDTEDDIAADAETLSKLIGEGKRKPAPLADPEKGLAADGGKDKVTAAFKKLVGNLS